MQVSNSRNRSSSPANTHRAFEIGWLIGIILIPLASWPESQMLGFIQIPKIFIMRTLALYFLALITFESITASLPNSNFDETVLKRAKDWIKVHPARLLILFAGVVLLANIFSVANSPIPSIGILGIDVGWDTYALANTACYVIFFYTIATHLKTYAQIRRIIWCLTFAGAIVGLVAIGQHFGIDPFRTNSFVLTRAHSTLGNSIFAGSFLIMVIPLTLLLFLEYQTKMGNLAHTFMGGGLIALQVTGLLFALSRGPLIGMIIMIGTMVVLLVVIKKANLGIRIIAMFAVALTFALIMTTLPTPDRQNFGSNDLTDRIASIGPGVGGSLSNRYTIWRTSIDAWANVPWVDTEKYPELPEIGPKFTKTIFGYGPDMFQHAYPLVGESTYTFELASHGHSFLIHTLLETGLFGLLAYIGLFLVAGLILFRLIKHARQHDELNLVTLTSIGLLAILIGRTVEQIPGKAQVSDLLLMWVFLGMIAALPMINLAQPEDQLSPIDSSSKQRKHRRRPTQNSFKKYRFFLPILFSIFLIFIWYNFVLAEPLSAMKAREAQRAAESGQIQNALDMYQEAQDLSPRSAINYLRYAEILLELSKVAPTVDEKTRLIERALLEVSKIIDRQPMDNRTWSRIADMEKALAKIDPTKRDNAFHSSSLLTELLPGFWQPHAALAWTYAELGEYQKALNEVEIAAKLSLDANASASSQAPFIPFVEAFSLEGLGRTTEAIDAVNRSLEMRRTEPAEVLLSKLMGN